MGHIARNCRNGARRTDSGRSRDGEGGWNAWKTTGFTDYPSNSSDDTTTPTSRLAQPGSTYTEATETFKMTIPKEKIGAIIGPSGSRITMIRKESVAKIKIMDSDESGGRAISIAFAISMPKEVFKRQKS